MSHSDRRFDMINNVILVLLMLLIAYPLWFTLIASISNPTDVVYGRVVFWPRRITLSGYRKVFENKDIWTGYRNSAVYTLCYTCLSTLASMMAGYAVSRKSLPGRGALLKAMVFTMYFSGGLIPSYLVNKTLGLVGNPLVMILVGVGSVNHMLIIRAFINGNIPEDLFEAASLDGCTHFQYFFKVVLPLSGAVIAVIGLYNASGCWNAWFNAMIYLRDRTTYPLQLVLRNLLFNATQLMQAANTVGTGGDYTAEVMNLESIKYGIIIVASVPMLILYPFVQKFFVKGVMVGAIKG